jgi:hypothetical protein
MPLADSALDARLQALARAGAEAIEIDHQRRPPGLVAVTVAAGVGAGDDLRAGLEVALERLRRGSAREALAAHGLDLGFRLEDLISLAARVPAEAAAGAAAVAERWLRRRLPAEGRLALVEAPGPVALAAAFASRVGWSPARDGYRRGGDGRVRVEAFELHLVEHCNLRCAHCCNMSPLVAERTLSLDELEHLCRRMAEVLEVDVFKIMGGEPLLHPDIVGALRVIRGSGISGKVRLFTNGLRLGSMKPEFWSQLDELTISSYSSAPVKPHLLALAREQARAHDFVLNVKEVAAFSQVLSPAFRADVDDTFRRCWLRHRCLVVRGGRFYMCTRAAYAEDFLARAACEPVPAGVELDRAGDGVAIDAPDLAARLVAYMNRPEPLAACHHCLGGDGPLEPHHQLTRADVAAGRLSAPRSRGP